MAITFFSLGVTLQVLLIDNGASSLRAFVASFVIFSATSQFAYLAVRDGGGSDWAAIAAGWVVATRFGILAVSLAPRLPAGFWRRASAAAMSFDPNVAVAVQQDTPRAVEREFWRTTAGMFLGWFGPRGLASILFALIVVEQLDTPAGRTIFTVAAWTVLASIFLHGLTANAWSDRLAHRLAIEPDPMPENVPVVELPTRRSLEPRPDERPPNEQSGP